MRHLRSVDTRVERRERVDAAIAIEALAALHAGDGGDDADGRQDGQCDGDEDVHGGLPWFRRCNRNTRLEQLPQSTRLRVTRQVLYVGYRSSMTSPASQATVHPADHVHVADLDACLDLINTVELDGPGGLPEDSLPKPDDAIAWLAGRSLAHEGVLRAEASPDPVAWLGRVHATRDALREVWEATVEGRSVDHRAVAILNEVLHHGK